LVGGFLFILDMNNFVSMVLEQVYLKSRACQKVTETTRKCVYE